MRLRPFRLSLCAACALFLCSGPVAAQPLSIDEAVRQALASNRNLKDAEARIRSALAARDATAARALPLVRGYAGYRYTSEYSSISTPMFSRDMGENNNWRIGIQASYPVWAGGRTDALLGIDVEAIRAARHDQTALAATIAHVTRVYYYNALLARQMIDVAQKSRALSADRLTAAQKNHASGSISRLELRQNTADLADAEAAVVDAGARYDTALVALQNHLDMPTNATLSLVSSLTDEYAALRGTPLPAETPERPEILALKARLAAAGRGVDLAQAGWWPTLALTAGYEYGRPFMMTPGEWGGNATLGLELSIPLSELFETGRNVRRAESERERTENALAQAVTRAAADRRDLVVRLAALSRTIEARGASLGHARDVFAASSAAWQNGSLPLLELSARELSWRRIESAWYGAICEYLVARSDLARISRKSTQGDNR